MATTHLLDGSAEWLESDGLGGFACGTADTIRTRRYHGMLSVSLRPPVDRVTLVSGLEVWVETPAGRFALSSHRYLPDVVHPDGRDRLVGFSADPWPTWTYRLEDGTEVVQELTVPRDEPIVLLSWRISEPPPGGGEVRLLVRPLLCCRDAHSLHKSNESFNFEAEEDGEQVRWHPYLGIPGVVALGNGTYEHDPVWYHGFLYPAEQQRGLDCTEDLASPGSFRWRFGAADAVLLLTTDSQALPLLPDALSLITDRREAERRRRVAVGPAMLRAAEAFLVRRGEGRTILAGYPWSTEWGRDTFVALRGLCIATGRLEDARQILLEWTDHVSGGLLPNFFAERRREPEFNSVDSSLWYIVAVHEFLRGAGPVGRFLSVSDHAQLREAINSILAGYLAGTRYNIGVDEDGLLRAGEPGSAMTWMDARFGDWMVTPRIGKPVEVQALWINALRIGSLLSPRWKQPLERASASFLERFWYGSGGYLLDVVDVDHRPGSVDTAFRPNQILAVGGLPFRVLRGAYARRVVEAVESRLLTPVGLRTLAPGEPRYVGRCADNLRQFASETHLGSAWPWLLGPFVEAWVRVRGDTPEVRRHAKKRFLDPLLRRVEETGLGHVPELFDGDAPHAPRGAPFQAWSLGEMLRLSLQVLAEPAPGMLNGGSTPSPAGEAPGTRTRGGPVFSR